MKIKEFLKTGKAKVLTVAGLGLVGASSAFADITYTTGSGFSGTIDTVPFTSMAGIFIVSPKIKQTTEADYKNKV